MPCPPRCAKPFSDKFTFYHMPRSHILCYAIPGGDGSITEGKRRLNWVWYWNYREADELPGRARAHRGEFNSMKWRNFVLTLFRGLCTSVQISF
jgi:hypothetical protein